METNTTTNMKQSDFVANICLELGLPALKFVSQEEFMSDLQEGDLSVLATSNGTIEPISRADIERLLNEPNNVQQ